ncbi:MAG TPA: aminomethyltransferase beta-barrel domain-containing protein, partial [Magnetospirillaceae bacterium]
SRDQSYFLCRTTREELEFLRFPLGDLTKGETRTLARRYALPVAAKPDSQDICFVPNGSYADFVTKLRPGAIEPGEIVDADGTVLGRHDGIVHFTVGQRKGIGIAATEPLYVLRLEPATHRVVVGPHHALGQSRVALHSVNWLGAGAPEDGMTVAVKLRSAQPPVTARLHADGCEIVLDEPAFGVAPGQACVFYDGTRVLGGGWIARDPTLGLTRADAVTNIRLPSVAG